MTLVSRKRTVDSIYADKLVMVRAADPDVISIYIYKEKLEIRSAVLLVMVCKSVYALLLLFLCHGL